MSIQAAKLGRLLSTKLPVLNCVALLLVILLSDAKAAVNEGTKKLPVIDKQDIRIVRVSAGGEDLAKWIHGITQDNQGFLWFATDGGLFRYDGYTVTPYRHDPGNPNSISSDNLRSVYKDRSGILWIGTVYDGVDRLDPVRGVFTHYRPQAGAEKGLGGEPVNSIYQDRSGTLWVGTEGGLDRLDPSTGAFLHYRHDPTGPASLSDSNVRVIYEDHHDNLWVGTKRGLNKLDRVTGRSLQYLHDPKNPRSLGHDFVSDIVEDRSGVLWVASWFGEGLSSFDTRTQEFTHYSFHPEQPDRASISGVSSMHVDADGSLWVATTDSGLFRLDAGRKKFDRYTTGNVARIFEDAEGVIWIGTRSRGVMRFLRKAPAFGNYQDKISQLQAIRENDIQSVGTDSRGSLWIGTAKGLYMLDRKTGRLTQYKHDAKDPYSLGNSSVSAIVEDRTGAMWFGTYGAGFYRFDRATGRFFAHRYDPASPGGLSNDLIRCMLLDHEGMLWIGTESGVDRYDPGSGEFKNYRPDPSNPHSLVLSADGVLLEDHTGALWVGCGPFLSRLDRKSDQFTAYRHDPKDPRSLTSQDVDAIYEDHQGTLWVGTRAGLSRLDPSGTFTRFTMKDGLPDPSVKAILEDHRGGLWLATHNGLSHFSPQTKQFRNYFESDGLPNNNLDILGQEAFQTASGEMVFGASNGLAMFDPDRISPNSYIPPVVLTDFLLFNKPVTPGKNSPLRKPIWGTDALTLNHNQGIFTLEFAALSYAAPERNRYRYRLEGLESEWNEVESARRVATYTNLSPGRYVFRVQGSNNDLLWNEAGVQLAITVLPPWWSTWWFRTALVLCVVGLIITTHRVRMRGLQLTAARLERKVAERTLELNAAKDAAEAAKDAAQNANRAKSAFLSHMSHELRTPLTAILGFAGLLRNGSSSEKERSDLDVISRSGEHLLGLIDDVLDLAKIESGRVTVEISPCDLGRLVNDVTEMIRVRASAKNLTFDVAHSPEFPPFVSTDASKLRQMLINLLGNAVKYTEEGGVTLRMDAQHAGSDEMLLIFEVRDTGIGIVAEDRERIFDPFFQVGKTRRQKGTGLGLAITRQFAELLGGSVRVTSTLGEGSVFRLELPARRASQSEVSPPTAVRREYVLEEGQQFRILAVDDETQNGQLLERLLSQAGFQVEVACDSAEAIEKWRVWRPHFIWMDLRMPGIGGVETARRIREMDGGREVKIVALTASERKPQQDTSLDDFVRKPYRVSEIFDCLAHHLGLKYCSDRAAHELAPDPAATLRPEALAALPQELRVELEKAVTTLNTTRINAAIVLVCERDAALGSALAFHAKQFAFTKIYNALQRAMAIGENKSRTY